MCSSKLFPPLQPPRGGICRRYGSLDTSKTLFSSPALVSSMQKVAQHWERLLFASDRALALQKCFFYLIEWSWDNIGKPTIHANFHSPEINLFMSSGRSLSSFSIPRIECSIGKRSLGVRVARPDGSFLQEYTYRLDQESIWTTNISKAPLSRTDIYTAFMALWSPAIAYPPSVTSFTRAQCTSTIRGIDS